MTNPDPQADVGIEASLAAAAGGDEVAVRRLLEAHRDRLRRVIAARLNRRLAARLDPSDVVQETLAIAARRLRHYLRVRPMPFYAWLFRLALDRVSRTHRDHLVSKVRGIYREERINGAARERNSVRGRFDRLADSEPTPGHRMVHDERKLLLARAMEQMEEDDRELLGLRYVNRLSFDEIAASLDIGLSAAKMRHLRALARLRPLLEEMGVESSSSS